MTYRNICPNCFENLNGSSVCKSCGYDLKNSKKYTGALPELTMLNKRYLIGRVLGRGGFGITYKAKDMALNKICAIKEYMPAEYAKRGPSTLSIAPFSDTKSKNVFLHGKQKYLEEAHTMLTLRKNPNVVDIYDFIKENNTAYLVMEYIEGADLRKQARSSGGKLNPQFAETVFVIIASALMEIHEKGILHRDISPENIMTSGMGEIKLIDFGAARNYVRLQNKGMSILLKPGFAPPEQYSSNGKQGPWTDVYALCATFYNLVSGKQVVDAIYRERGTPQPTLKDLKCSVSDGMSKIIDKGLQLDISKRYKNFKELLTDYDKISSAPSVGDGGGRTTPPTPIKTPPVKPLKPPIELIKYPYIAQIINSHECNKTMIGRKNKFVLGRAMPSNYLINDPKNITTKQHCYLRYDGEDMYICDTSTNGTFLENGHRLVKNKEIKISFGTKFYLADRQYMFVLKM